MGACQDVRVAFGDARTSNDAFLVRRAVFVQEQGVPEDEVFDRQDAGAIHVVGYVDSAAVAAARCVDEGGGRWRIGWVCTRSTARGTGAGTQVMSAALESIRGRGGREVVLSARDTAVRFYRNLGFRECGEVEELGSGVVLVPMRLPLQPGGGAPETAR